MDGPLCIVFKFRKWGEKIIIFGGRLLWITPKPQAQQRHLESELRKIIILLYDVNKFWIIVHFVVMNLIGLPSFCFIYTYIPEYIITVNFRDNQ